MNNGDRIKIILLNQLAQKAKATKKTAIKNLAEQNPEIDKVE